MQLTTKLTLALALGLTTASPATSQQFMRNYGVSTDSWSRPAIVLDDGDIVQACVTSTTHLKRTDPAGNVLWAKYFYTPGGTSDNVRGITELASGDLACVGFADSRPWVFTVNALTGALKMSTLPADDGSLGDVVGLPDGTFVAVGSYQTARSDFDVFILKMDAHGTIFWRKVVGSFTQNDRANHVIATQDGGFAIAGYVDTVSNGRDLLVMKLDQHGTPEWSRHIGTPDRDGNVGTRIRETAAGDFVVTGSRGGNGDDSDDFWLVKLNPIGNLIFDYIYDFGIDESYDVVLTDDGGYALVGKCVPPNASEHRTVLAKLYASGVVEWAYMYGGDGSEFVSGLAKLPDGGFLISGQQRVGGATHWTPFLTRTDAAGQIGTQHPYVQPVTLSIQFGGSHFVIDTPSFQTITPLQSGPGMAGNDIDLTLTVRAMTHAAPWQDLGQGTPGGAGIPELVGFGRMEPGQALGFYLQNGTPLAPTVIIAGLSELNAPFMGGTLVPFPDVIRFLPATNADGILSLAGELSPRFPAGGSIFLQMGVFDSFAPSGVAFSNAVTGTAP